MLAREKAVLGFYITRHPLASQEKLLEACATASTVDLAKYDEGATVIVGGIVSSLRTVIPRKGRNAGKRMGIVTLEDLKGRIEAVLFADKLPTYQADLVPDAVLFLEGKVDRRREEPSLHVTRVVTAENAVKELATALLIDLAQDGPIEELVGLLRKSPGECRVYLNVATGQDLCAQIECHPSFSASCTPELLGSIIKLLGSAAVHVLGPTQRPMTIPSDIVPQSPTAVAV
ncbi:MAG: hypothetical protein IID33_17680 [Planctomycetes bacterium]|nr:hypothetical protein [Planctomycetota bacterium]